VTRYQLVSASGAQSFDLAAERPLVLGRALACDLPVIDPTISRRHAELSMVDGRVMVRDLGSSNGTFLNGTRVEAGTLAPGDTVTFGKVSFDLRERTPTPAELAAAAVGPPDPAAPRAGATIVRERRVPHSRESLAAALHGRPAAAEAGAASTAAVPPTEGGAQRKLELLLEVSKGLSRARDPDLLLGEIAATVFELLEVDRVAVQLLDEHGDLVPRTSRDAHGRRIEGLVPQSIARRAVEERVAILSDNAPEDARFGGASIIAQGVRSAICVPLMGSDGQPLGVLYVDNSSLTHRYTDEDLGFLIAFAGIAGVAIENSQFAERIRREALVRWCAATSSATSRPPSPSASRSRRARRDWAASGGAWRCCSATSATSRRSPSRCGRTRWRGCSASTSRRWSSACSGTAARSTSSWATP
jgi:hypothetical protein